MREKGKGRGRVTESAKKCMGERKKHKTSGKEDERSAREKERGTERERGREREQQGWGQRARYRENE